MAQVRWGVSRCNSAANPQGKLDRATSPKASHDGTTYDLNKRHPDSSVEDRPRQLVNA